MDYQETMEEEQLEDEGPEQTFATIGAVYSDGVSLLFDGADDPTEKHYKVNTFFKYRSKILGGDIGNLCIVSFQLIILLNMNVQI